MAGVKGKEIMEHRLSAVETAVTKLTDAIQRLTTLEEHYRTTKETMERSFTRLEAVETSIKGDGQQPGLFTAIVELRAKLEGNTFLTRLIVALMVTQFIGAIGVGMYIMLRAGGVQP